LNCTIPRKPKLTNRRTTRYIYYEDLDLSGIIEGIDYMIEYGVNSEDNDEEA
jgi:hypothetical protein